LESAAKMIVWLDFNTATAWIELVAWPWELVAVTA
jgi:hypothetical protein